MNESSPEEGASGFTLVRILLEQPCFGATFATTKNMLHLKFIGQSGVIHSLKIIAPIQTVFGPLEMKDFICMMVFRRILTSFMNGRKDV